MLKVRKRDIAEPVVAADKGDVVRLSALISDIPPADLSSLEAALRSQQEEIAALRALVEEKTPPDYNFEIKRGDDQRIRSVYATPAVPRLH